MSDIKSALRRGAPFLFTSLVVLGLPHLIIAFFLLSYSIGIGIDAYYYSIQIHHLVDEKALYFPTYTPLPIYFLTILNIALQDSVIATKIGALYLSLMLSAGTLCLVRISANNAWLGLFSALTLAVSSLQVYLVVEYVSYLGAIVFIAWGCFFSVLGYKRRKPMWFGAALACFIVAAGSHRSAIPMILTLLMSLLSLWLLQTTSSDKKLYWLALAVPVIAFFTPAILDAQPFLQIPSELARDFTVLPGIPAKLATLPETIALLFLCPLTLLAVLRWRMRPDDKIGSLFFGTVALWGVLLLLNPFISSRLGFQSVGGRIRVLSHIIVAILASGVVWLLYNSARRRLVWLSGFVVVLAMIWSSLFNPLPRGAQTEYLAHRQSLIESLHANGSQLTHSSLVVAEHGDQFVVTSVTGIPSQKEYPKETKYDSVYWLLNKIPSTLVDSSMIPMFKDPDGLYTVIVKEGPSWEERMLNPQVRAQFVKYNYHLRSHLDNRQQSEEGE